MSHSPETPAVDPAMPVQTVLDSENLSMKSHQPDRLSALSDELLLIILANLPAKDVLSCQRLSRKFRAVAQDNLLWKRIYFAQYKTIGKRTIPDNGTSTQSANLNSSTADPPVHCNSDEENHRDYWLRQCMLCHNWSKAVCDSFAVGLQEMNPSSSFDLMALNQRTFFMLDNFGKFETDTSGRKWLVWNLYAQDIYQVGKVTKLCVRKIPERSFHAHRLLEAKSLLLNSREAPSDADLLLAILWNDELVQICALNPSTLCLRTVVERQIKDLELSYTWDLATYHHPYLTFVSPSHGSLERRPDRIDVYEINEALPWKVIKTLAQREGLQVTSPRWRAGMIQPTLDLIWIPSGPRVSSGIFRFEVVKVDHSLVDSEHPVQSSWFEVLVRDRSMSRNPNIQFRFVYPHFVTHNATCELRRRQSHPNSPVHLYWTPLMNLVGDDCFFDTDATGNVVLLGRNKDSNFAASLADRSCPWRFLPQAGIETRLISRAQLCALRPKIDSPRHLFRNRPNKMRFDEIVGEVLSDCKRTRFMINDERILAAVYDKGLGSGFPWSHLQVYDFRRVVDNCMAVRDAGAL